MHNYCCKWRNCTWARTNYYRMLTVNCILSSANDMFRANAVLVHFFFCFCIFIGWATKLLRQGPDCGLWDQTDSERVDFMAECAVCSVVCDVHVLMCVCVTYGEASAQQCRCRWLSTWMLDSHLSFRFFAWKIIYYGKNLTCLWRHVTHIHIYTHAYTYI